MFRNISLKSFCLWNNRWVNDDVDDQVVLNWQHLNQCYEIYEKCWKQIKTKRIYFGSISTLPDLINFEPSKINFNEARIKLKFSTICLVRLSFHPDSKAEFCWIFCWSEKIISIFLEENTPIYMRAFKLCKIVAFFEKKSIQIMKNYVTQFSRLL